MDAIEYDMAKDTLSFIGGVRKLEHKRDTGGHGKLTVSPDGGLNIGRRMLVVVRPQSQGQLEPRAPSQSSTRSSSKGHTTGGGLLDKANAVQVIDHGANQKEAVRRLFDAHVMIASLEEQLTEKELEINRLSKELEKVGLDSEKSQVTEKADPRAHGDKMEHFEQSKSSPEQPSPKKVDKQRIALEKVQNQEAKQAGEDRRGFPKWLQADQHSRQIIERMWSTISQEYFDQNILEKSTMINNLWSCGYDFVMRWGGSPNEQLENQVKSLTEKNIRVTKEAQMENSMLRQHIRKIEVQYKKMQDNSHRLQLAYDEMRLSWSVAHSPSNDQMGDMSRTTSMAAMGDGEATMTPGAARRMSQSISTTGETSVHDTCYAQNISRQQKQRHGIHFFADAHGSSSAAACGVIPAGHLAALPVTGRPGCWSCRALGVCSDAGAQPSRAHKLHACAQPDWALAIGRALTQPGRALAVPGQPCRYPRNTLITCCAPPARLANDVRAGGEFRGGAGCSYEAWCADQCGDGATGGKQNSR